MSSDDDVIKLAEVRARKKGKAVQRPEPEVDADQRPVVRIFEEHLRTLVTDRCEQVLIDSEVPIYHQGGRLVKAGWGTVTISTGETHKSVQLLSVPMQHMLEVFDRAIRFEKWDGRCHDWVPCTCPIDVAATYVARTNGWKLPYLRGVVSTPVILWDGSTVETAGYEGRTGLLYEPGEVVFPPLPVCPTKEDALQALDVLMEPIKLFPYRDETARAIALSAILTAVMRSSLDTAPMHAFTAPTAGSGKSALVDVASIIATGERAGVITTGNSRDGHAELEKRLTASLLAGCQVISVDNVETSLGGELLCAALTQTLIGIRPLGKTEMIKVPVSTAFFATGNNLQIGGDLTRRVLTCTLDPGVERPELREFDFDPLRLAAEQRPTLVVAALTIIKAWMMSGERPSAAPLGSFVTWSQRVRDPLMWLGLPDPVLVLEETRVIDPILSRLRTVLSCWSEAFGDAPKTVTQVVDYVAEKVPHDEHGAGGGFAHPEFSDALHSVASSDAGLSKDRLGRWLAKSTGRVFDGMRLLRHDAGRVTRWSVSGGASRVSEAAEMGAGNQDWGDIPF